MALNYYTVFCKTTEGSVSDEFDTLNEANEECESYWDLLTTYEQRRNGNHYYVKKGKNFKNSRIDLDCYDSDEIGKYRVEYDAGPSREDDNTAVDYMLANVKKRDGSVVELYAEMVNPTWDDEEEALDDEYATFLPLRREMMDQAEKNGIHPSRLYFDSHPDRYDDDYVKIDRELYQKMCSLAKESGMSVKRWIETIVENEENGINKKD